MNKTAFVTGISGQDGSYLAKLLLEKGYHVVGGERRNASGNLWRLKKLGIEDSIEISDFESNVLTVNGTAFIHHLNLPDSHELVTMDRLMIGEALTLNVGASFVVSQNDDIVMAVGNNRVGIGVDAEVPSASLHIVSANVPAFNFSDPDKCFSLS